MKMTTRIFFSEKLSREYVFPSTPGSLKSTAGVSNGTMMECIKAIVNY
jgi:hypothetical protein